MPLAITSNDSASSPSWSRLWMGMGCENFSAQALGPHREAVDAARDGAGQEHAEDQGHEVDDEEETAHHGHGRHQHPADVQGGGRQAAHQGGGAVADPDRLDLAPAARPVRDLRHREEQQALTLQNSSWRCSCGFCPSPSSSPMRIVIPFFGSGGCWWCR